MNSENIYKLGKLKLEEESINIQNENFILKTYYECNNIFCLETTFFLPCYINFIGKYLYSSGFHIKRNTIDSYDIIYVYEGELKLSYKNRTYTVSKNDVIFVHKDLIYEIMTNKSDDVDIVILSINGLISKEYYNLIMKKGFSPISIKNPNAFDIIFNKILFYMKYPSSPNKALIIDTIIQLYTELYLNSINFDEYDTVYGHPKWFISAMSFLNENYNKNISINKLSEECGFSSSYLHKLFKDYTGISPYNYLLSVRINNAKNLLLNKELSVKFISYTVGFKSVNHFINHFKKITGSTPNSFRNKVTVQMCQF